ncbi:MAG: SurA N-terminal domain-containing protein [Clostridium sp.]|nr:SurA N-terminal domain-containing protein [Clostridium sp.]MDU7085016.1 SurA N-terminal domain-containing protein [Clostridium sp.]
MLKKLTAILALFTLLIVMTACSGSIDDAKVIDTSEILVTVDKEKITQQDLDMSMINSYLSEKESIENLINNRLLLLYSKDLKVKTTKKEITDEMDRAKKYFKEIENDNSVEAVKSKTDFEKILNTLGLTEKEYWNSYAFNGYKKVIIIGKTKEKLGNDLAKTLQTLRNKYEIKYYNN